MNVYYWKAKKNFGDLLTSYLLDKFTHLPSQWSDPKDAELVMVGSIIEHLPSDWGGVIAGCGKLHERTIVNLPKARIIGVRGPLTARGLKGNFVIGDPGLLANELVPLQDKEYDLGIVAHWTDKTLELDKRFLKFNPKIIKVGDDPLKVISEIGKCKKIVSSSLHGIILADSFGIPRRIEIPPRSLSHPHQEGGLFKWLDYSASLNIELKIGVTQEVDRNKITEKQHELFDMLEEVKTIFS